MGVDLSNCFLTKEMMSIINLLYKIRKQLIRCFKKDYFRPGHLKSNIIRNKILNLNQF